MSKPQCNTSADCLREMTPTIEEVKLVALDGGAFVAIECVTYSLKNGEIVFTKEQLQAFAQHWIEVGRKEQREKDAEMCDKIADDNSKYENTKDWSAYLEGMSDGADECATAIRNNTGE